MKHQHFEEWLFSEEPLQEEEEQALLDYLWSLKLCRTKAEAWREVKMSFVQAVEVAPHEYSSK